MRGFVLSTGKQMMGAGIIGAAALWMGVCTAAMLVSALSVSATDQELARRNAYWERVTADRQARLNSAMEQLSDNNGGIGELAQSVEKRHAALALLLTEFKGAPGAVAALAPAKPRINVSSPIARVQYTLMDQERIITAAEGFAQSRAERLRLAFRLAGLNPDSYASRGAARLRAKPSAAVMIRS